MEERFDRLQEAVRTLESLNGTSRPIQEVENEEKGERGERVERKLGELDELQEKGKKEESEVREEDRESEERGKRVGREGEEVWREDYEVLKGYMESGKWRKDFEADEKGKLPAGLKRGVLSEDGLYNLLEDVRGLLEEIAGLAGNDD